MQEKIKVIILPGKRKNGFLYDGFLYDGNTGC